MHSAHREPKLVSISRGSPSCYKYQACILTAEQLKRNVSHVTFLSAKCLPLHTTSSTDLVIDGSLEVRIMIACHPRCMCNIVGDAYQLCLRIHYRLRSSTGLNVVHQRTHGGARGICLAILHH